MTTITSEVIKVTGARLSFPKLWSPKAFREGQAERFESTFLLDPSNKKHQAIIQNILDQAEEVILQKFSGKIPKKLKFGFGYSDGDDFQIGGETFRSEIKDYAGYPGMFYISCSNRTRPTVVDRHRNPLVETDGKPYAGCYVNGTLTLWPQDNEFGQRVNANLRGVQFTAEGEAFGAKPVDAEEEFDELEDIDDESGWE